MLFNSVTLSQQAGSSAVLLEEAGSQFPSLQAQLLLSVRHIVVMQVELTRQTICEVGLHVRCSLGPLRHCHVLRSCKEESSISSLERICTIAQHPHRAG
jgi:hypothetical protein